MVTHSSIHFFFKQKRALLKCFLFLDQQNILLEKEMQPTPVFLTGKSHGLRSLVGYNPWGLKESDTTEQLTFTFKHLI